MIRTNSEWFFWHKTPGELSSLRRMSCEWKNVVLTWCISVCHIIGLKQTCGIKNVCGCHNLLGRVTSMFKMFYSRESQFWANTLYHTGMQLMLQHLAVQFSLYYLSIGRSWEVKNKRDFQTFSSKSGCCHLQETPNILKFWYFGEAVTEERWLLMRNGLNWRFSC